MGKSSYRYNQLGIGDCGHVVGTWPQVSEKGGVYVVCEPCTREQYKISDDVTLVVWVRLDTSTTVGISKPKTKAKRESKPKKLTPWQNLLRQEGLF